jgi:PPM family protein phosphatase
MAKVTSCGITDIGRKRQKNEDSYLVNDKLKLYIVADGMGGHAGGEFASKIAVSTVEEIVKGDDKKHVDPKSYLDKSRSKDDDFSEKLRDAITRAGSKICQRSIEDPELRGMGTTASAVLFHDKKAFIAHVGDSRVYCFRDNNMNQITEDHSLVHEQLKSGLITEDEAKSHQLKNIITRSVGVQEEVEVDTIVWPVKSGDKYLLCSDGLSNMVTDIEIKDIVNRYSVENGAKTLVDLANERGGDDNITLIIIKVDDTESK